LLCGLLLSLGLAYLMMEGFPKPVQVPVAGRIHKPVQVPVPGRRCPNCLAGGKTVWVIPGKNCPECKTEVN